MILAAGALILDKTVLRPSASKPQNTQANMAPPVRPNTAPASNNSVEPVITPKSHGANEPKNLSNPKNFGQTPLKVQNAVSKLFGLFTGDPSPPNLQKKRNLFSASDDFMSALRLAPANLPEPNNLPDEKPKSPVIPLKLTGIVIGPYRNSAYINDEVCFPDQNIGPYQVLSINPDSVVLATQNERLTLFLDK